MIWVRKFSPFLVKLQFFCLFYFLIMCQTEQKSFNFFALILFVFSFVNVGILGYIINDISDEKADLLAGKTNVTHRLNIVQKTAITIATAGFGIIPISFYAPVVIPFLLAELLLLFSYAFPPFRLKEKGILGVLADSFYAYLIPSFVLLVYLEMQNKVDLFFWFFLPVFSFFLGVKNILAHQLEDFDNDTISGSRTFAIDNMNLAKSMNKFALFLSVFTWIISLFYLLLFGKIDLIFIVFLIVGIISFFKVLFYGFYKEQAIIRELPEYTFLYYTSIILLLYFLIFNKYYLFIFLLFCVWNIPLIDGKFLVVSVKKVYYFFRKCAGLSVNYFLYYLFLFFGIDLKDRADRKKSANLSDIKGKVNSIPIKENNVHGLWIGNELSFMEILTIKSFIKQGYRFHLWTYETVKNELPEHCICCDANEIIPESRIFKYKFSSQFGTGKGSYAGFSDIFRYKLLHDIGGWWVDMDVTCLKPFDIDSPYFFRAHHDLPLVGNIMKAPKGSELMLKCYKDASREVDENNRDWHKPIEILVNNVFEFNLQEYIVQGVSNSDEWHKIMPFVQNVQLEVPVDWFFIHWCNEVWRSNGYSKNSPLYNSFYGQLLSEYEQIPKISSIERSIHDRNMRIKLSFSRILEYL